MKPWGKQTRLKGDDSPIPDINYIIDTARTIKDNRTRALYCLLYLSGGRICELVRKTGYDLEPHHTKYYDEVKKKERTKFIYSKIVNDTKNKPSIKRRQLRFENLHDRDIMIIDMRNEKNRDIDRQRKSIPVPFDNPEYAILIQMIREYSDTLDMEAELFPFNYQYAYKILKPYFNPHWFRHIRATHLTLNNDLSGPLLRRFMGWTDDRPSTRYQEMKFGDILDKL